MFSDMRMRNISAYDKLVLAVRFLVVDVFAPPEEDDVQEQLTVVPDQTTLIANDVEAFALGPIDVTNIGLFHLTFNLLVTLLLNLKNRYISGNVMWNFYYVCCDGILEMFKLFGKMVWGWPNEYIFVYHCTKRLFIISLVYHR